MAIVLGATSALATQELPKKGTCGLLASMHYPFAYQYGPNAGPGWGLNVLATLDFDSRTFNGNIVLIDPKGPNSVQTQQQLAGPFAVSAGPIPGSYTLTTTLTVGTNTSRFTWNVLPVNNGRTLLFQQGPGEFGSADGGVAGVCQF